MKGGINKVMRNIAASTADSEFEKRLTKATYGHDTKEPKEKHVVYILECLNNDRSHFVTVNDALQGIFERHIDHSDNWAVNFKCLIVIHRALQNLTICKAIRHKLKKNFHHLEPYKKDDNKEQVLFSNISYQYKKYLEYHIAVCNQSHIMLDPARYHAGKITKVKTEELLGNYQYFRSIVMMTTSILKFQNFGSQTRLLSNVIFMVLNDLLEIYRVFHNHIIEILERFPDLNAKDAQKAFSMYENFLKFTESLKKKGPTTIAKFSFAITLPQFYQSDQMLTDTLKAIVASLADVEFEQPALAQKQSKDEKWKTMGQRVKQVSFKLGEGTSHLPSKASSDINMIDFVCNVPEQSPNKEYVPDAEEMNPKQDLHMDESLDICLRGSEDRKNY